MEEIKERKIDIAALKAAIHGVDVIAFKKELEKITQVSDLTEAQWSVLVRISSNSIVSQGSDFLKRFRERDDKAIFRLLLEKLMALSSAKEKLTLTAAGFEDCRAVVVLGEYGLNYLYRSLKNKEGYTLRFFLMRRGPACFVDEAACYASENVSTNVSTLASAAKIAAFKNGDVRFEEMWKNGVVGDSGDKTVIQFLIKEFCLDLPPVFFKMINHYGDLTKLIPALAENKILAKSCRALHSHFLSKVASPPQFNEKEFSECYDLLRAAIIENRNSDFLIISHNNVCERRSNYDRLCKKLSDPVDAYARAANDYIVFFSLFIKEGVSPWLETQNGKTLYDCMLRLKEEIDRIHSFFDKYKPDGWEIGVAVSRLNEARVNLTALLKLVEPKLPVHRMREALCVWKFGQISFFCQIPRDVMQIIGGYVLAENKNSTPSVGAKLG